MEKAPKSPHGRLCPPASKEEIEPKLLQIGMAPRDIRHLFSYTEFLNLPCRNHQLYFFNEYIKHLDKRYFPQELSLAFNMDVRTVRKSLKAVPQEIKEPGRHNALNVEKEEQIIEQIKTSFENGNPMTQKQIIGFIHKMYGIEVTFGWINSFLCRHSESLQKCKSFPQEDLRMIIPRDYLEKHITNLKENVAGTCSELLFNLDEVGLGGPENFKGNCA